MDVKVTSPENASKEGAQEIEMTVIGETEIEIEIEDGAGPQEEETDLQGEADLLGDTATTLVSTVEEDTIGMIAETEIEIVAKIDQEISIEGTGRDLDLGLVQGPILDPQLRLEGTENADPAILPPKKSLKIIREESMGDVRGIHLLIRTAH